MVDDVMEDNPSPVDGIERSLPLDADQTFTAGADPKAIVRQDQPPLRLPDTPNPTSSPPEGKK